MGATAAPSARRLGEIAAVPFAPRVSPNPPPHVPPNRLPHVAAQSAGGNVTLGHVAHDKFA
jgi:hypothetical protein